MAAVLRFGSGAVLSHRSAGQLWEVLPRTRSLAEVTSPAKVGPGARRDRLVVHHTSVPPDEIDERRGIPVTSVFRTIFDLAAVLSKRQLERALHEAEVQQLTDRLSLPDLLERHPGRRGAANLRAVLASGAPIGVTQNDFEELFVEFLDLHGLPRPQLNGTLAIRGRLLKPDCMWSEERLIVELDGGAVHRTARAFETDRQRDRILLAEGWRSLRVTWRQLREEPAAIAADLGGLLRSPGRAPTL